MTIEMSFAVIRNAFLLPEKNLFLSRMIVLCNMFLIISLDYEVCQGTNL